MSFGGGASAPGEAMQDGKTLDKKIRKRIMHILAKLLEQSLLDDKREKANSIIHVAKERNESLSDAVNVYGLLINTMTKKQEIITGARTEHFPEGILVFYTVDNDKLFTTFPAAGKYQGPYTTNHGVFVEVIARMNEMYICKPIDHIRYVELMGEGK